MVIEQCPDQKDTKNLHLKFIKKFFVAKTTKENVMLTKHNLELSNGS